MILTNQNRNSYSGYFIDRNVIKKKIQTIWQTTKTNPVETHTHDVAGGSDTTRRVLPHTTAVREPDPQLEYIS